MEWKRLSKAEAKQLTGEWNSISKVEFDELKSEWPKEILKNLDSDYTALRKSVISCFNEIVASCLKDETAKEKLYSLDYRFGLRLYMILKEYGFSLRQASSDEIWIYLCINVFPDIVQNRFSGKRVKDDKGNTTSLNVNEDRFWKVSRRIYLKTLWWYIHLSLQYGFNAEDVYRNTEEVIRNNSTDTVVQLVERSGRAGYRVELYREIIRYYSNVKSSNRAEIFRKVMVLNTAKTIGIEPQLYEGGYKGYVKELFEYFEH